MPDELVCSLCRSRLETVIGGCDRCHQPVPPIGPCRFCAPWPRAVRWISSAVWLGDEARQMVHHLKYEGYTRLASSMARLVTDVVGPPGPAVLVPVPLGPRRQRLRGFNQAGVIARALAARWGLEVASDVLRRVRDTSSQTGLAPEERETNVRGAFQAAPRPVAHDENRLVILVDDVLTTGATMVAAGTALAQSGWHQVGGVTFARALPYDKGALSPGRSRGAPTNHQPFTPFSRPG